MNHYMKNIRTNMTNVFLSILILLAFPVLKENNSSSFFTGNANFYYISKLDDGSIINVPYRMLNTTWSNQHNNFELIGKLTIEYQPKKKTKNAIFRRFSIIFHSF